MQSNQLYSFTRSEPVVTFTLRARGIPLCQEQCFKCHSLPWRRRLPPLSGEGCMEWFYAALFAATAALATTLELTRSKDSVTEKHSKEFSCFKSNYVQVYTLMMGAPAGSLAAAC